MENTKKLSSKEQLAKELGQVVAQLEALAKQKAEKEAISSTTPSTPAVTTSIHEAGATLPNVKKTVRQLFNLYLTNQFVARATNVRADTLISCGYKLIDGDDEGRKACNELIENSGGVNLFWQLSVNTDIAGDGFLEKVKNTAGTKILRLKHVHPLTLQFKTDDSMQKIIVDAYGKPIGYVQYVDADVQNNGYPYKDVPLEKIAHFKYNSLGDEFTGLSPLQPAYDTIVRLMNMEYSAAEAAIKTANPLWVAKCNTKSPHQIAQWGQILGKISGKDQIFIPEGMELDMKSPGQQNFNEYADYFLNAVVSAFGVPKGILLGGSGGGNRAQEVVLSKHFYDMIGTMQLTMEAFFNEIFKEYAEIAGFKAPKLVINDVSEDKMMMADSVVKLFTAGIITKEEARLVIGYDDNANQLIPFTQGTDAQLKDSDMKTWHDPNTGSQAGNKAKMETSPNTTSTPGPYQ
jgi:hypothetical protein